MYCIRFIFLLLALLVAILFFCCIPIPGIDKKDTESENKEMNENTEKTEWKGYKP